LLIEHDVIKNKINGKYAQLGRIRRLVRPNET
jgi:hypothetical protein